MTGKRILETSLENLLVIGFPLGPAQELMKFVNKLTHPRIGKKIHLDFFLLIL